MRLKNSATLIRRLAQTLGLLATVQQGLAYYDDAEESFKRCKRCCREGGGQHRSERYSWTNQPGDLYIKIRLDLTKRKILGKQALTDLEEHYPDDKAGIAGAAQNLAVLYRTEGKNDEAEALYQRSLKLIKEIAGVQHPAYANVLQNLSVLMREEKKYDEAETLGKQSLEIWTQTLGENNPTVGMAKSNLAKTYSAEGKYKDAEELGVAVP